MVRTRVGYTGGSTPAPTYRNIGDHSEALQIDFDPEVISYTALVEIFWRAHNPCSAPWSTQYKSAVFYASPKQKAAAEAVRDSLAPSLDRPIQTPVLAAGTFTRAEDYHQKYSLRNRKDFFEAVRARFEDEQAFIDSTAAARLNGYLSGGGNREQLSSELELLDLPPELEQRLLQMVRP